VRWEDGGEEGDGDGIRGRGRTFKPITLPYFSRADALI